MRFLISFLLGVLVVGLSADNDPPIVRTPLGVVSGFYNTSINGRRYRAFEGIPFGKAPIGELRFEPPQPYGHWTGILDARNKNTSCVQYNHRRKHLSQQIFGNEDCLFLNIYTAAPENSTKLLPVLFDIFGGGFRLGESRKRAEILMSRDFVVVTFNYRLGPLGFLSTGDDVVPGNMGLKDQSLALRWVYDNIKYFGGDPKKITLTGASSGSACVHYHYLSPLSRGLFHAGISISGTVLNGWAQTEAAPAKAKKIAADVGCPTENTKDMIKCLKFKPAFNITHGALYFMPWHHMPFVPFGPVVEVPTNHSFIDRPPIDIITSGDVASVPWLTSISSEEGLDPVDEFIANTTAMEDLDKNWEKLAKHVLDYNYTLPQSQHAAAANKIRKHYLGNSKIDKSMAVPLIALAGDRTFKTNSAKAAQLMAKANRAPVWFYYYSYRAEFSRSDQYLPNRENLGVAHCDDSLLIFPPFEYPVPPGEKTLQVRNLLLNIWSSMAENGTPNFGIDWPPVHPNSKSLRYLSIPGPTGLTVQEDTVLWQRAFWDSIGFNENRQTIVTSSTCHPILHTSFVFIYPLLISVWILI